MRPILFYLLLHLSAGVYSQTYAEKLGFPTGAKVLILHVDDVGMSYDSNLGTINAMTKGVANSCSMMMPCGWIPGYFHYLKQNQNIDAGLHLTLTSEWKDYRWGPLAGKKQVPGLVDEEGAMWPSVEATATHATADEVAIEINAQLERALAMGWKPTHLDSHMGTLFARQDYLQKYIELGIKNKIPVMFPGGHNTMIMATSGKQSGLTIDMTNKVGQMLWQSGLPVLDDLHNDSYGWKPNKPLADKELQAFKTKKYIESIKKLKPGLTMVIMHCTAPTEVFSKISDSGITRKGDLLAMQDPAFKKFLQDEKIILTTWREVMERREKLNN